MTSERNTFRYSVGMLALVGGLLGLIGLYIVEVPVGNRDAVMLALGIVLGWGSTVVNGEWGSSPAGREMAKVGVEASRKAAEGPLDVHVSNSPSDPAITRDATDTETGGI